MKNAKHFLFLLVFALCTVTSLWAETCPADYYNRINGASDSLLKGRLKAIIRNHTVIEYGDGSWEVFYYADRDSTTGDCMDMYCDSWKKFTSPGNAVSGCNVEHSFAKSWWGGAKNDAYKDCFHLNPSNSTANSSRSNYPPGIPVKELKDQSSTGSLRVGKRYHDTLKEDFWVFEPKDEYKGDFARAYFYMATCYGRDSLGNIDKTICSAYQGWRLDNGDVGSKYGMQNDNYLEFQPWLVELLLDWHRKDPVSGKELQRQNAVSNFQHNRNPYIDYPCLVEYIWGNRKGQKVDINQLKRTTDGNWLSVTDSAQLTGCTCDFLQPVITTAIQQLSFPTLLVGKDTTKSLHLIHALLPEATNLKISGRDSSMFAVMQMNLQATQEKYVDSLVTVIYRPTTVGQHTAILLVESPGVDTLRIQLRGTCARECQITWLVGGEETTSGSPTTRVVQGGGISAVPNSVESCSATSETFMGWTAMPIDTPVNVAPKDLFVSAEDAPTISRDTVLYAVFAHHTETGSAENVQQTASPTSTKGWTVSAGEKSSDSYWVLSTGSQIVSPEIEISALKQIDMSIRTYGGKSYNTVNIYWGKTLLGSLAGSSSTLHDYKWENTTKLQGKGTLSFSSSTTTKENGPGVASICLTLAGITHTYSAYTTNCGASTAIQETRQTLTATKVIRNGQLLILREGQYYTLQGQLITAK